MIKTIIHLSIGAAFGVGMVLSCSNGSPSHTDAATCDCPAAEPPISGRTVVIESAPMMIAPGTVDGVGASCPTGMEFLSGGCQNALTGFLQDTPVTRFGFDKQMGWTCAFKNNLSNPVQVKATVLCLKPPT